MMRWPNERRKVQTIDIEASRKSKLHLRNCRPQKRSLDEQFPISKCQATGRGKLIIYTLVRNIFAQRIRFAYEMSERSDRLAR